LFITFSIVAQF